MRRNSYYADPEIGAAAESLVTGIFGGGEREATRARAGLLRSQRDGQELENERAIRRLNTARMNAERLRQGAAPGQSFTTLIPELYANAMEGADPQVMQVLPNFVRGAGVPLVPTSGERDRLALAAGEAFQNTEGGRVQAEAEAARRTGISAGATVRAAQIASDGATAREVLQQSGLDRRQVVALAPNTEVLLPRNSPAVVGTSLVPPEPDGPVRVAGPVRPENMSQAQATILREIADPATTPERREQILPLLPSGTIAGLEVRGEQARTLQDVRDAASMARVLAANAGRVQVTNIQQEGATNRVTLNIAGQEARLVMRGEQAEALEITRQDGRREIMDLRNAGALERGELEAAVRQAIATGQNASREGIAAGQNASREGIAAGQNASREGIATGQNASGERRAEIAAGAVRDAAATRAGAAGGAQGQRLVPGRVGEDIDRELGAELSARGIRFDTAATRATRARAEQIYQDRTHPANGSALRATQAAIEEMRQQPQPRTDWRWNPLSSPQYGAPSSLVPAPTGPAAPPAAASGGFRAPNGQIIPEGGTIRQNGQTFIIRNGVPVPGA